MMYNKPKAVSMTELSPIIADLVESGTDVIFTVTGESMQPTFYNLRDTVVLTKCEPLGLKKRQIPLYLRADGRYVLHRIVKVNTDTYDMCGDHQYDIEHGVSKDSVICVVKGFTRNGKYHDCNEIGYKVYSFIWTAILPLRRYIIGLYRIINCPFSK